MLSMDLNSLSDPHVNQVLGTRLNFTVSMKMEYTVFQSNIVFALVVFTTVCFLWTVSNDALQRMKMIRLKKVRGPF